MRFRRAVQRYGRTPEPVTPFQKAAQLWDERIGSARVQARNWRLAALLAMGLSAGLGCGLVWQSLQSRVIPYVVEVDKLGEARAVAPAEPGQRPTDPQIAWHLAKFIANVRTISLDPVVMRENWLSAYDFVDARGGRFLAEHVRANDPFGQVGTRTVSVQVTSVVRASDRAFQVKWIESAFERGSLVDRARWTALLTVRAAPPRSADELRRNPLGIKIEDIDWAREIEPVAQGSVAPPAPTPSPSVPSGSPLDPGPAAPMSPTSVPERNR